MNKRIKLFVFLLPLLGLSVWSGNAFADDDEHDGGNNCNIKSGSFRFTNANGGAIAVPTQTAGLYSGIINLVSGTHTDGQHYDDNHHNDEHHGDSHGDGGEDDHDQGVWHNGNSTCFTQVSLAYECKNPTACDSANPLSIKVGSNIVQIARNPSGSVTNFTPVSLEFVGNGIGNGNDHGTCNDNGDDNGNGNNTGNCNSSAAFSIRYDDVGEVTLWVKSAQSGHGAVASSNSFVVNPDHFDTAATPPLPCPSGLTCPTGMVYSGQPFGLQVTSKNALGNTTTNYRDGFAKAMQLSAAVSSGGTTIATGGTNQPTLVPAVAPAAGFAAGVNSINNAAFTFVASPTSPTDVYMRVTEGSGGAGVSSLRQTASSSVEGGVKVVSGRIQIPNVYGSEKLPLPVTATVQYYNGAYWMISASDNFTAFNTGLTTASGDLVATVRSGLSGGVSIVGPGLSSVANGVRTFKLAAPLQNGSVDLSVNSYLPSLKGRAIFGVYGGSKKSPVIHIVEN